MRISHTCSKCGHDDPLVDREAIVVRLHDIISNPKEKSANVIFGAEKLLKEFHTDRKDGVGTQERVVYRPEWLMSKMRDMIDVAVAASAEKKAAEAAKGGPRA